MLLTAVLSTHTGGFTGFTYRDLTEDLCPWQSTGSRWAAGSSPFTAAFWAAPGGSAWWSRSSTGSGRKHPHHGGPGDGGRGKLYKTYTPEMASGMARLCGRADIVVPNMTEAHHLLEQEYDPALTPGSRSRAS